MAAIPQFPLYQRRETRTVFVGQVGVGGRNPLRIQSMCISATTDTIAIVREMQAIVAAGCEIVRLTVPTQKDCDNLPHIRAAMKSVGLKVPLVADIHFTPSIAIKVVDFVEKVRINPGNFVDKKLFKSFEYTDAEYAEELVRIEDKFVPLVERCKQLGTAMRIGTNHGSLSDRIMNRYGDTPLGMVESALEFLRIAIKLNYHDIIFSMKASNTQIMVTAYRELARRLAEHGWDYPFHLGVTEAGEGEDGRIKSAIGIGTLLEEGIGDTIRVSLTEDSEHEIPVATMLATPYNERMARQYWFGELRQKQTIPVHLEFLAGGPFSLSYERRRSDLIHVGMHGHGGTEPVRVWKLLPPVRWEECRAMVTADPHFEGIEFDLDVGMSPIIGELRDRNIATALRSSSFSGLVCGEQFEKRVLVAQSQTWASEAKSLHGSDLITPDLMRGVWEICYDTESYDLRGVDFARHLKADHDQLIAWGATSVIFSVASAKPFQDYRILAQALSYNKMTNVIHLRYKAGAFPAQLDAATQIGGLLIDGVGDSIQLDDPSLRLEELLRLAYNILQGARVRISKTEYISCPSCGRTQFNIQETTERIRRVTNHLKGVKIAVMGCIVNGPGEMADADFGYVGTGTARISLYVGKECVERNIPEENAVQSLVDLIKKNDRWVDV